MAGAIRLVSIERGHDPSHFALMPFGGGGALHAGALVQDVGLQSALVPRFPGITSALGCVIADLRHDQVRTVNLMLDTLDADALDRLMVSEGLAAERVVADAGVAVERIDIVYELDMHYMGQTHTIAVPLPVTLKDSTTGISAETIRTAFEKAYRASFSRLLPGIAMRIVTLRTAAIGRRPSFDLAALAPTAGATCEAAARGTRPIWFGTGWRDARIWSRLDLPVGTIIEGPAVLEQPDATTIVDPGLTARVDALGNVILERKA
jgi:N-methylhydantoinase A